MSSSPKKGFLRISLRGWDLFHLLFLMLTQFSESFCTYLHEYSFELFKLIALEAHFDFLLQNRPKDPVLSRKDGKRKIQIIRHMAKNLSEMSNRTKNHPRANEILFKRKILCLCVCCVWLDYLLNSGDLGFQTKKTHCRVIWILGSAVLERMWSFISFSWERQNRL